MSRAPAWYRQLKWSSPITVTQLNLDRSVIPDFPGCYVWTIDNQALKPGVLYVGEAKTSLRQRLPVYLVDWTRPVTPGGRQHKGKGFILEARSQRGDHGVYVRWVEYGGAPGDISLLESSLMDYLSPQCNDRDESVRHGLLADWETLIPGLLR